MDWETKVLRRVERSVESLTGVSPSDEEATGGFGWEEASLRALRRRLKIGMKD